MNYTNDNVKKICNFYMSDWHFIVMLLPYINREMNRNTKVITILENDMKDKVKTLIDKLNLKNKEDILRINWRKSGIDNLTEEIKKETKENKKNILIINGTNCYIEEVNRKINEMISRENFKNRDIKIIDCYGFDGNKDNMKDIIKKYEKILNTSGEINVEEIF